MSPTNKYATRSRFCSVVRGSVMAKAKVKKTEESSCVVMRQARLVLF